MIHIPLIPFYNRYSSILFLYNILYDIWYPMPYQIFHIYILYFSIHLIKYVIFNFQDSLSRQEFFFVYFGFPLDWLYNIIRLLFCQYFLQLILFIFHYSISKVELSDFSLFILMFTQYYTFSNRMLLLTSYACACPIVNQPSFTVDILSCLFYTSVIFLI